MAMKTTEILKYSFGKLGISSSVLGDFPQKGPLFLSHFFPTNGFLIQLKTSTMQQWTPRT